MQATDVGGKRGTANVNVVVTDINDESPVFEGGPYSFRVREGESGADVGKVLARDSDSGDNANVQYSVPEESPFSIDAIDGRIRYSVHCMFSKFFHCKLGGKSMIESNT